MEIRDPEFNRFFSEALKLLSTRRRFCGDFIFRGFVRVFLFSFLSFCFLSLSFFQTDFSFASESHSSSRSLSQGDACNKVLIKVGAREAEQPSAQQQPSASDLNDPVEYPWLKPPVPRGFWDIEANQEKYMEWLGEKLGFSTHKDWYGLTKKMIEANSGSGLLQKKFNGSPADMVMALVEAPEGGWRPWLFGGSRIWDIPENQKAYMEWLGEKLGYTKPEDWYGLSAKMIRENGGSTLLRKFNGSPADMVMALVEAPEGGWVLWEFSKVPKGFWDNEENQKDYMKWLGKQLGYTKPEDWLRLTKKMIEENSGSGLLQKFNNSPAEMVMALVEAPEGDWLPWEFKGGVPKGFWDNEENQKAYMKWLGEKLEFSKLEDWYGLTGELIEANSGSGLLQKKFNYSPAEMVKALVEQPEGGWKPWEFKGGVPDGFWDIEANQKAYMKWLAEKLEFSKLEDWYGLTKKMIEANSGGGLLYNKFNGSPAEMVKALVKAPEGGWKEEKFNDRSKMEGRMRDILTTWFGGLDRSPSNNDRKTHRLTFGDTNRGMEADVLFEDLKFAIEYQGRQHYEASDRFGGEKGFEETKRRDQEKREAFKNAGYIYIEIPYDQWKDGVPQTLKELILSQLVGYQKSSDYEVKQRAFEIREALEKVDNTQNLLRFGESGSSGSESDPAESSTAASPNTASVGR